jgi:hypothetical protein
MKIAIIKWTDSALHGQDTLDGDDESLKPMEGFSCGLLVKEDKDGVTIATDYWGKNKWRNCATIYKKQIEFYQIKEIKTEAIKKRGVEV